MTSERPDGDCGRRHLLGAGLGALGGAAALTALAQPAQAAASDAEFYTYPPTRVVDSRAGIGTLAGKIKGGQSRTIVLPNFSDGFTLTAIINLTVTSTERNGYLTVWQTGETRPGTSSINWWGPGQTYGNLAVVGLRSTPVSFDIYCGNSISATHFLVDLVGYFYRNGSTTVRSPAEKRVSG